MSLSKETGDALTSVVAEGVGLAAGRLQDITHDPWRVLTVTLSQDEAGPFAAAHASLSSDHYGSHITFPGGSFLLLFSGKTGYLVTSAFTRDFQDRVENMNKREAVALGEVSNVLLNPFVGHLAKAWNQRLIISAPTTGIGSPRDHLTRALARYQSGAGLGAAFFAHLDSPQLFSECRIMLFLDRELLARVALPGG